MDKDIQRQDIIDRYLLNEMSSDEKLNFEKEMESDTALKEYVETQKIIIEKIIEREKFKTFLKEVDSKEIKTAKIVSFKSIYSVLAAAAVLAGIIFLILQPTQYSNSKILSVYNFDFKNDITINTNNNGINVRGDECNIENLTSQECLTIKEALLLYDKKDYSKAAILFEKTLNPLEKNLVLDFYMAISQLKSGNIAKAIDNFYYLSKQDKYIYAIDSKYYLALAYIKDGKTKEAKKILHQLKKDYNKYSKPANEILRKLRWF